MPALSIGMATYKDFDGLYFTIQALRMYHDLRDVEFVVIDNYGCDDSMRFVQGIPGAKYIRAREIVGTAVPRNRIFAEATGDYVLCCDAHVEFAPGAIACLLAYFAAFPDTRDLIQGPLLYDDLHNVATHFDPVWINQMWGAWGTDPRGLDPAAPAFDIPSQGLGVFACRRDAWLGFNPRFRGFGGEEGYIHEKFRMSGARTLCLPGLRWVHRFGRPNGVPYPVKIQDKFRNYLIGHRELGLDLAPIVEHFRSHLNERTMRPILREILGVEEIDVSTAASGVSPAIVAPPPPAPPDELTPVPNLPLVSCICATYNRAPQHLHLLEEAIESFLRQDYPNKELIILNDTPGQTLACDAPGVRIINAPNRLPTLGAKHNLAISASHGDLIAIWDDDDINLPWRLSLSVARLGDADYFNPGSYWFRSGDTPPTFTGPTGYAHNASLFRRSAWAAVNGYPSVAIGTDAEMDGRLRQHGAVAPPLDGLNELARWFYVYRRGVSPAHLSMSNVDPGRYTAIGTRTVGAGDFTLTPRWRTDYLAETQRVIAERDGDGPVPLVSCICCTYNRAPEHLHLIEEAIESFLRQDYPNKELIVLNDTPGQELVCDAPGVRIINAPERYPSLGEKRNAAIAAAQGEFIAIWDDDDINLPWRLSLSVAQIGDAEYFNPTMYWFIDGAGLHFLHPMGYALNCALFRRAAFDAVGGFPPLSIGEDAEMDTALRKRGSVRGPLPGVEERDRWFYIYRWGVSAKHVSGGGNEQNYADIGKQAIAAGTFTVTPRWRQDYLALTRAGCQPDLPWQPAPSPATSATLVASRPPAHTAAFSASPAPIATPPPDREPIPDGPERPPLPHRAIFFHPARPDGSHILAALMARHGWSYAASPDDADLCMLYLDETVVSLPPDDPYAEASWSWINGRCRDISKTHVDRVFAEIFGYQASIDPLTYTGPCVMKADENYRKGAQRLLTCPLTPDELKPGMVYQRLVDSHIPMIGYAEDHADIIGGRVRLVRRTVRPETLPPERFFLDPRDEALTFADSIFTDKEQEQIARFCAAIGCDVAKMDIIRDRTDDRLYILDVNKTPGGSRPETTPERLRWEHRMDLWAQALIDAYPSQRHTGPATTTTPLPPAPTIFFYPEQPNPRHLLPQIIERFGWTVVDDPEQADLAMLYRDHTYAALRVDDRYAGVVATWINGRGQDISKRHVQEVFARVFGYPIAVDPLTWQGPLIRKSNENFTKDVVILQGPLALEDVHERYVYQRVIDGRSADGRPEEFYMHIVGDLIATVTCVHHPDWIASGILDEEYLDPHLVPPASVSSAQEQAQLIEVCSTLGLDLCKLDVIRDHADGRLYVLDAAKTPGGRHGEPWDAALIERWLTLIASAITRQFTHRHRLP